jgi:hypothetical protein
MDADQLKRDRDRRLRRRLLFVAKLAMGHGFTQEISGRALVSNATAGAAEQFEDDAHAITLLRELCSYGFLSERDTRTHRGQRQGLEMLSYRITGAGLALLNESHPAHPDIDDERIN